MIQKLYIKNFAIIDEVDINFKSGLTVITGETGAGKSILLEALGIVLGGKADKIMVRNGAERAVVDAKFSDAEIRRVISKSGRTKSYKDDEFLTLIDLKKDNMARVDFHGQHDQQLILDRTSHIDYLDSYCRNQKKVAELEKIFSELITMRSELDELNKNEYQKKERMTLLKFQANEIDMVNPLEGEDQEVKKAFKRISNLKEIMKNLTNVKNMILDSDNSLTDQLNIAYHDLNTIEKYDSNISNICSLISESILHLEEAGSEINSQLMGKDFNSEDLSILEDRLNALESLKRKYGGSIESVILERKRIDKEIKDLKNISISQNILINAIKEKENDFAQKAIILHNKRKIKSKELSEKIALAMSDLDMVGSRFNIIIDQDENDEGFVKLDGKIVIGNPKGVDRVEFYLSANPGEPTKPLSLVASGGEISRIMLAIKTVLQDIDPVQTLVFDEIDSGISGKAAEKVSMHLFNLSQKKQIICITHLSQIARQAHHHLHIKKYVNEEKTYVDIQYLNDIESSKIIQELFIGTEAVKA